MWGGDDGFVCEEVGGDDDDGLVCDQERDDDDGLVCGGGRGRWRW